MQKATAIQWGAYANSDRCRQSLHLFFGCNRLKFLCDHSGLSHLFIFFVLSVYVPCSQASEQSCLCNRPMTVVFCGTCCCSFKGRAQRSCGEHPKVIHLMDTDKCPKCYSDNLIERTPSGRQ
uniref:Protein ovary overexpressed n=1 Tax=Rhipicephalus microplus TaxID=6941 RepID=A0A6M2CUX6_RHIMP